MLTNFSMRTKMLLVTFSCFFGLVLVLVWQFTNFENNLKKNRRSELYSYVNPLREAIRAQFFERYGDVQAFAFNSVLNNMENTENMSAVFDAYTNLYGIYSFIGYFDLSGNLIASNNQDINKNKIERTKISSKDVLNSDWFKRAVLEQYDEDKSLGLSGTVVGHFTSDKELKQWTGREQVANSFTTVVRNKKDEKIGILHAKANVVWISNDFKKIANTIKSRFVDTFDLFFINSSFEIMAQIGSDQQDLIYPSNGTKKLINSNLLQKTTSDHSKELFEDDRFYYLYLPLAGEKFVSDLGWSLVFKTPKMKILGEINNFLKVFYYTISVFIFLSFAVLFFYFKGIHHFLKFRINEFSSLRSSSEEIQSQLQESSSKLSQSGQEQAAAIQETVSALSEMSSMISQTGQSIKLAQETSNHARQKTIEGVRVVEKLNQTMQSIKKASDQIFQIAKAIDEIGNKTTVINDIVFKSQLLSFNASIEAARAGQQGRGFAVVAEEVGNLAEMSGDASLEIEHLIKDCKQAVREAIDTIQMRVVDGVQVGDLVHTSFKDIATRMEEINSQVQSINEATQQQEIGIQQSNTAMKEMDLTAQQNSEAALRSNSLAVKLGESSEGLFKQIKLLNGFVLGGSKESQNNFFLATSKQMLRGGKNELNAKLPTLKVVENDINESDLSLEDLARQVVAKKNALFSNPMKSLESEGNDDELTLNKHKERANRAS